jgi:Bacterial signalling protein N terminal repeat
MVSHTLRFCARHAGYILVWRCSTSDFFLVFSFSMQFIIIFFNRPALEVTNFFCFFLSKPYHIDPCTLKTFRNLSVHTMNRAVDPIQATQHFDGGLIFLSYVISVIGAQTTLELLGRRTSVKGAYNLFLLCGSALAMGSVGIWSMHFIGNNALKLSYNDTTYQLVYAPGFTFISLVVAIICMFLSFAFVCSTEEVLMTRIVFSGVVAGVSIFCKWTCKDNCH